MEDSFLRPLVFGKIFCMLDMGFRLLLLSLGEMYLAFDLFLLGVEECLSLFLNLVPHSFGL